MGYKAGQQTQGQNAIAIGSNAGQQTQGNDSVAMGNAAGRENQGQYSVAVGYQAGQTNQFANSIVINASGTSLSSGATGFYVKPIRQASQTNTIFYDPASGELSYATSKASDKTNIISIGATGSIALTSNIYKLQPREYTYISDNKFNIGFIAEEVFLVDKNLCVLDALNNPINIKWYDLTTYMLAEIQRLNGILVKNNIQ